MHQDMNAWQEVLHQLIADQLVQPKRIAFRLQRHSEYLSDVCRRDRVDPIAIFNAILQEAESTFGVNPQRTLTLAQRIFTLLTVGTNFYFQWAHPLAVTDAKLDDLWRHVADLLKDLGRAIDSLREITKDGRVTESDDVAIAEFDVKANRLIQLFQRLHVEIHARRNAGVSK